MTQSSISDARREGLIGAAHSRIVFGRRTRVLAGHVTPLIPSGARVLDVGCGDGTIDELILSERPDLHIEGIDPLVRPKAKIPVRGFDGSHIPYSDFSVDVVMFVDVLHHTDDPGILLREAARVGRTVIIKDHLQNGLLAGATLSLMDWVGNARYGVSLPYNYWPKKRWLATFDQLGLEIQEMKLHLDLYPAPLSWFFDRDLHFIARLRSSGTVR